MPYASISEVYGENFGNPDPAKLATQYGYGMRSIDSYNQESTRGGDSVGGALPSNVGTANMAAVKFNSETQYRVNETGNGMEEAENQRFPWADNDEPRFTYSTMQGKDDENEIQDVYENFKGGYSLHERFIEHFSKCSTCREKVWEKFSNYIEQKKKHNGGSSDIREMFSNDAGRGVPVSADKASTPVANVGSAGSGEGSGGDNYVDVLVMILLGIFIIFVLDAFVKLGKSFSS